MFNKCVYYDIVFKKIYKFCSNVLSETTNYKIIFLNIAKRRLTKITQETALWHYNIFKIV